MEPWAQTALIVTFLAIFVLTALITLAGIIMLPDGTPLLAVEPGMLKGLYAALIAQVIGCVIVSYKTFVLGRSRIKKPIFRWTMAYERNVHREWLRLQSNKTQEAVEDFIEQREKIERGELENTSNADLIRKSEEEESVLYYLAFEEAASHTGIGRLVLIVNEDTNNIEGISEFTMPEAPKIPVSVTKGKLQDRGRQLTLTFDQPDRIVNIDSVAFRYRAVPFDIQFEKEPDSESYKGVFRIPVGEASLTIAKTFLAAETSS